jgi:hypothetical protein
MWKSSVPTIEQPTSYLLSPSANDVQQAVLAQWGIEIVPLPVTDPTAALEAFLEAIVGRPARRRRTAPKR